MEQSSRYLTASMTRVVVLFLGSLVGSSVLAEETIKPTHTHLESLINSTLSPNISQEYIAAQESRYFVHKVFEMHGNPQTISKSQLIVLLEQLGLGVTKDLAHSHDLTDDNHRHSHDTNPSHDHSHEHSHEHSHDSHKHSQHDHNHDHDTEPSNYHSHDNPHKDSHGETHTHTHNLPSQDKAESTSLLPPNSRDKRMADALAHTAASHNKCMNADMLLSMFHMSDVDALTPTQFSYVCPALVYQLSAKLCHGSDHHNHDHSETSKHLTIGNIPGKVWGYSCLSVAVISLVGLLGVAVIPIMQKVFYNHMLQFLVALAVGALSGDAMLHLIPHSIVAHSGSHDHSGGEEEIHDHSASAWKGLAGLGGIVFFFIMERLLTIITVMKRNKRSKKHRQKRRCEKYCHKENNKKSVGSRLSHHRHSTEDDCDRTVMMVHPNKELNNKSLKSYADAAHEEFMHQCDDDLVSPMTLTSDLDLDKKHGDPEGVGVCDGTKLELDILPHEGSGEENGGVHGLGGHSHGSHSHSHTVPNSVAAVAWMVILGDGIHNFSDGLAIGAAFANSITGGFSTSVAVFCHELPHEIGDFAVLLRAGMSAKQAIMYNCLSSILCFFGMVIGVAIGNMSSASLWIFAVVGGMFLYIALVDMLPEMSSVETKKGENPFFHLMIQVIGIVLGSSIMLVIAVYEADIKTIMG